MEQTSSPSKAPFTALHLCTAGRLHSKPSMFVLRLHHRPLNRRRLLQELRIDLQRSSRARFRSLFEDLEANDEGIASTTSTPSRFGVDIFFASTSPLGAERRIVLSPLETSPSCVLPILGSIPQRLHVRLRVGVRRRARTCLTYLPTICICRLPTASRSWSAQPSTLIR